jgi:hypothetical protein
MSFIQLIVLIAIMLAEGVTGGAIAVAIVKFGPNPTNQIAGVIYGSLLGSLGAICGVALGALTFLKYFPN